MGLLGLWLLPLLHLQLARREERAWASGFMADSGRSCVFSSSPRVDFYLKASEAVCSSLVIRRESRRHSGRGRYEEQRD